MTAVSLDGVVGALRDGVELLLGAVAWPVLVYFLVVNTSLLVLILVAAYDFTHHLRRVRVDGREEVVSSRFAPGVSVVVPMYNEEAGIVEATRSLLGLRYPRHEVVIVDDGSTDGGFEALRQAFDLVEVPRRIPTDLATRQPARSVHVPRDGRTRLVVVRKDNSGRSDSINVGVNAAVEELVVFIDADSIVETDALLAVTKPFTDDPARIIATGGVIRAANGCRVVAGRIVDVTMPRSWLARIQVVEYLRAFYLGRTGWSRLDALILISGAFGVFRRDLVVQVGGLDAESIGEDFELVMRMHRTMREEGRDYRIKFVAEPVVWTEVPESRAVLRRQRSRWHRGLWETLWKYRRMLANPRYGRIGLVAVPYYWLFELLAPLLELAGLVLIGLGLVFGVVNLPFAILFMVVAYGYAVLVGFAAIAVEELSYHRYPKWSDLRKIAVATVAESFGYRQMTGWWRLQGWWASLRGRQQVWGTMTRTGFSGAAAPSAAAARTASAAGERSMDDGASDG